MLERLLDYERGAFFLLNGSDSEYLDRFMWLYTGKVVWLPLAAFILILLIYRKNWREWLPILLAIALVITLCDQFSSHLVKPYFERFRPTHHPEFEAQVDTVFGYRGGLYGFISSHAANAFGFAMFMSLLFRNAIFTWAIMFWAALTAYTRIYLGVHFITDIIPGALAGLFFGYLVYIMYAHIRKRYIVKEAGEEGGTSSIYSTKRIMLIVYGILISVACLLAFNSIITAYLR